LVLHNKKVKRCVLPSFRYARIGNWPLDMHLATFHLSSLCIAFAARLPLTTVLLLERFRRRDIAGARIIAAMATADMIAALPDAALALTGHTAMEAEVSRQCINRLRWYPAEAKPWRSCIQPTWRVGKGVGRHHRPGWRMGCSGSQRPKIQDRRVHRGVGMPAEQRYYGWK